MKDEQKWPLVHAYQRAVEAKLVPPILCPDCETEMVVTPDRQDMPAFECYTHDGIIHIGLAVYDQMRRNLEDVHIEL